MITGLRHWIFVSYRAQVHYKALTKTMENWISAAIDLKWIVKEVIDRLQKCQ